MDFDKPKRKELPSKPPAVPAGQATYEPIPRPKKVPTKSKPKTLKLPKINWKKPTRRTLLISGVALIAIISLVFFLVLSSRPTGTQPQYKTFLPTGESITSLGGWRRVSPPEQEPVYAFVDTINGIAITVSQQLLDRNNDNTPEQQLEKIAKEYNATTKIKNTDAFIGTSAKGPQSVFLVKGSTLIMIKSQAEIPIADWSIYIRTLR